MPYIHQISENVFSLQQTDVPNTLFFMFYFMVNYKNLKMYSVIPWNIPIPIHLPISHSLRTTTSGRVNMLANLSTIGLDNVKS